MGQVLAFIKRNWKPIAYGAIVFFVVALKYPSTTSYAPLAVGLSMGFILYFALFRPR